MLIRIALFGSIILFLLAWIPFLFVVNEWDGGGLGDLVRSIFGSWDNLTLSMFGFAGVLFFLGLFVFPMIYERKFKTRGTEVVGRIVSLNDSGARINDRPVLEIQVAIPQADGGEKTKIGMKTPEIMDAHLYKVDAGIRVIHVEGDSDLKILGLVKD